VTIQIDLLMLLPEVDKKPTCDCAPRTPPCFYGEESKNFLLAKLWSYLKHARYCHSVAVLHA